MATKGKPAQPSQPPDDDATIVLDSETLLADATPEPADDAPSSDGATVVLEQSTLAAASADDSSTRVLPTIAAQSAESAPSVPTALPAALESAEADKDATKDPAATNQLAVVQAAAPGGAASAILDEIDPEWSLADQPTVQMAPQIMAQVMPPAARRMPTLTRPARPAFLETGEQDIWPSRPEPDSAPGLPTAARSGAYPVSDGSAAAGREPRGLLQPTHAPPDGAASAAWSAHTGSPRAQRQPARGPDGPPMVERLAAGPANRARSPARSTRQRRLPDPRARANARVRLGRRFRPAGGSGPRVWRPCSGAG